MKRKGLAKGDLFCNNAGEGRGRAFPFLILKLKPIINNMTIKKELLAIAALGLLTPPLPADLPPTAVPAPVISSVKQAYPDARHIEWDYDEDTGAYEAEFKINRYEHDLKVAADGKILFVKMEIPVHSLPAVIRDSVQKSYPGYSIREAEKITQGDAVRYKVEIANLTGDMDLVIDSTGAIIHVDH